MQKFVLLSFLTELEKHPNKEQCRSDRLPFQMFQNNGLPRVLPWYLIYLQILGPKFRNSQQKNNQIFLLNDLTWVVIPQASWILLNSGLCLWGLINSTFSVNWLNASHRPIFCQASQVLYEEKCTFWNLVLFLELGT